MDSFLFIGDFKSQIQADNLNQIIGGNNSILENIQNAAIEECSSYLKGKYDISNAMKPITQHDKTKIYKAGATVYLNAPAYSPTSTYPTIGTLTLQNGYIYSSNVAITIAEAFTIAHWTLLGSQYDIFNAIQPQETFDYLQFYRIGDIVFWKDNIYTAKQETQVLDHQSKLNVGVQTPSDIINVFPCDPVSGKQYWGDGVTYSVPTSTLITNATYWKLGDNRDQKLLQVCVDIALYHAHCRISPRNIPDLRVIRYMGEAENRISVYNQPIKYPIYCALGWLQSVRYGQDITPSMPEIQPISGQRILAGSNVKNNNFY